MQIKTTVKWVKTTLSIFSDLFKLKKQSILSFSHLNRILGSFYLVSSYEGAVDYGLGLGP